MLETPANKLFKKISSYKEYEYRTQILPTLEYMSQKAKVKSYQRHLSTYETHTALDQMAQCLIMKANKKFPKIADTYKKEEQRCIDKSKKNLKIVEKYRLQFDEIEYQMMMCEKYLQKWKRLMQMQAEKMRIYADEIDTIYNNCIDIIKAIEVAASIRNIALNFCNFYEIYYKFANTTDLSNNCLLVDNLENSTRKWAKEFENNDQELRDAKETLNNIIQGYQEETQSKLNECLDLQESIDEEKRKSDKYRCLLYNTKTFVEDSNDEQSFALLSLECLIKIIRDRFPKRLFEGVNSNSAKGKLEILSLALETYSEIRRIIKKKHVPQRGKKDNNLLFPTFKI